MYIIFIANGTDAIFIPINIVLWPYGHYNMTLLEIQDCVSTISYACEEDGGM